MCLDVIVKHTNPTGETKIGYKVFRRHRHLKNEVEFPYYELRGCRKVRTGEWLHAVSVSETTLESQYYHTGFHIFTSLRNAKRYRRHELLQPEKVVVVKVFYNQARIRGKQNEMNVVIADRMFVSRMSLDEVLYGKNK